MVDNSENATGFTLAQEVRALPREMTPDRDLWVGIERWLADFPRRRWRQPDRWMPLAVAASLVIAVAALLVNGARVVSPVGEPQSPVIANSADLAVQGMQSAYLLARNPLAEGFSGAGGSLPQAALDDLRLNLWLVERARRDLEEAVRKDPENHGLLRLLMKLHEQELELLREGFYRMGGNRHEI